MAQPLTHDVLILGAGLAGLRAAVEISRRLDGKVDIGIVSKVQLMRAHSVCAEGGTAAVLRPEEGDSFELHAWDSVKGSDFLADQDVVHRFVRAMPEEIMLLDHWASPGRGTRRAASTSGRSAGTRSRAPRWPRTRPGSSRCRLSTTRSSATSVSPGTTSSSSPTSLSRAAGSRASSGSTPRAGRPSCCAARRC